MGQAARRQGELADHASDQTGALRSHDLARVTADTTVQPKAISFPTDAKLLHAAIRVLNRLARQHGVPLRQSYLRIAKRAAMMAGSYEAMPTQTGFRRVYCTGGLHVACYPGRIYLQPHGANCKFMTAIKPRLARKDILFLLVTRRSLKKAAK